jgi:APA family basic amino acid/polyamine antiporter
MTKSGVDQRPVDEPDREPLKRTITGSLLFFYVLGDVLGSGIYALVGVVAAEVGPAFWTAFGLGISVATITGLAYAELVTRYPQAAGAALYIAKAFKNDFFTFVVTFCMLSASLCAAGALALTFGGDYFKEFLDWPTVAVASGFIVVLALINYRGISESVRANFVMTLIEASGLAIIIAIGVVTIVQGDAELGALTTFDGKSDNAALGILGGAALAFFAMTGFENAANVAEETKNPAKVFPKALIGGMVVAGVLYVLVAMTTAMVADFDSYVGSEGALLEVVRQGPLSIPTWLFALIALIAVANTCLVALITQSRILYGMAREDVVPGVFARVRPQRQTPWVAILFSALVILGLLSSAGASVARLAEAAVVFTLFIYALVIIACLKLRKEPLDPAPEGSFRATTALLYVGIVGNVGLLGYTVATDPTSLLYCAALLGLGLLLYVAEKAWSRHAESSSTTRTS